MAKARKTSIIRNDFNDAKSYTAILQHYKSLLQSKNLEQAEAVLEGLWNRRTEVRADGVIRARCGDRYGLCLIKFKQYAKVKRVLEDVRAFKKRLYPGPAHQEQYYTGDLIRSIPQARQGRILISTIPQAGRGSDLVCNIPRAELSSSLIRTIPQAGRGSDLVSNIPRPELSSSLVSTIPQTVLSDRKYLSKKSTRSKRSGFLEVLFS